MIAWNSQMALDARHHLYYQESTPQRVWKVTNSEGKRFVLKLYEVTDGTNAVDEGYYVESVHLDESEDFDADSPESGTEWAFVETSPEQFLAHYESAEELDVSSD